MTWEERKGMEKKKLTNIARRFSLKLVMQTCCPESVCQGNEREAQAVGGGQGVSEAGVEGEGQDMVVRVQGCVELCAILQYKLDKPESVEEPAEESEEEEEEEDTESIRKDESEDEDHLDQLARKYEDNIHSYLHHIPPGKMAIVLSSIISSLFSAYLLFSYVQLKMKASVSNMR